MGAAVAACPRDLGASPGGSPRAPPRLPSTCVSAARVLAGAHPPACPPPRAAPGKGAGNPVSRGCGPKRHGLEGARWGAGQLRASPRPESHLESVGAGGAHGEACPRPLNYGYQVRPSSPSPLRTRHCVGAGWGGAIGQGRGLRDTFPDGGGDSAERGCCDSRDCQGKEVPGPSLLSCLSLLPASGLTLSPELGLPLTAWEMRSLLWGVGPAGPAFLSPEGPLGLWP